MRDTNNLPMNGKRSALDWTKHYVRRCGTCTHYDGGIMGNCIEQPELGFRQYCDLCERYEACPEYASRIAVLDCGTRMYPEYVTVDTGQDITIGHYSPFHDRAIRMLATGKEDS